VIAAFLTVFLSKTETTINQVGYNTNNLYGSLPYDEFFTHYVENFNLSPSLGFTCKYDSTVKSCHFPGILLQNKYTLTI